MTVLNDQEPTVLKLVFWSAATKEMIDTTHASGRRLADAANPARITASHAWQSSVAWNVCFRVRTSNCLATATPQAKAAMGGRWRADCS